MKQLKKITAPFFLFLFLLFAVNFDAQAQALPEELNEGTLEEQYSYLHNRTLIYNNFRAIREDMFQKIRRNSLDSLRTTYTEIQNLKQQIVQHQASRDSIQQLLGQTVSERDVAVSERDNLYLLGIPMNKTFYNLLLWSIIGVLTLLVVALFIMFNRSNSVTRQTTKDLKELQLEYENHRKTARERYEQQSIDHFNELKRLRGI